MFPQKLYKTRRNEQVSGARCQGAGPGTCFIAALKHSELPPIKPGMCMKKQGSGGGAWPAHGGGLGVHTSTYDQALDARYQVSACRHQRAGRGVWCGRPRGAGEQKNIKNEGRSGDIYENKGTDDRMSDEKSDIYGNPTDILRISTVVWRQFAASYTVFAGFGVCHSTRFQGCNAGDLPAIKSTAGWSAGVGDESPPARPTRPMRF